MNIKKLQRKRVRRANRVRQSLSANTGRHRVSVFRSLNHIYAQLIDDTKHATLVASSSLALELPNDLDKTAQAKAVGIDLAKKALQLHINAVCFDRGSYLYHGRVKSLAEGLRDGGLQV